MGGGLTTAVDLKPDPSADKLGPSIKGDAAMPPASKAQIIRTCFAAYKARDRQAVEDLFTDDFRFTSPYDDEIDKAAYFERCWPHSVRIRAHVLERIFEDGDEAFVTYKCTMDDGEEFRNTEFFRFDGDNVRRIDVYFGATYKDGVFVKGK
jgi:ketosteroid isomerase-like protein